MSKRVLVIDDEEDIGLLFGVALKNEVNSGKIQLDFLLNAKDALDFLQEKSVDLIFCDINMPIMDGITLIKELRTLDDYKYIPILMLTTESTSDKKQQGKSAGATGWIVKPFNPDQLLATINKVLG